MTDNKLGELVCVILKGKNLPNRQKFGKQAPYAMLRVGSEVKRTKTDKNGGQRPEWDDELRFSVFDRPDCKKLRISIVADLGTQQKPVSGTVFDLTPVLDKGELDDWIELKYEEKYAGEVYIEFTFYSAKKPPPQPPPQPPQPPQASISSRHRKTSTVSSRSIGTPSSIKQRPTVSIMHRNGMTPSPKLVNQAGMSPSNQSAPSPSHSRPLPIPPQKADDMSHEPYEYYSSSINQRPPPHRYATDSPTAYYAPHAIHSSVADHVAMNNEPDSPYYETPPRSHDTPPRPYDTLIESYDTPLPVNGYDTPPHMYNGSPHTSGYGTPPHPLAHQAGPVMGPISPMKYDFPSTRPLPPPNMHRQHSFHESYRHDMVHGPPSNEYDEYDDCDYEPPYQPRPRSVTMDGFAAQEQPYSHSIRSPHRPRTTGPYSHYPLHNSSDSLPYRPRYEDENVNRGGRRLSYADIESSAPQCDSASCTACSINMGTH